MSARLFCDACGAALPDGRTHLRASVEELSMIGGQELRTGFPDSPSERHFCGWACLSNWAADRLPPSNLQPAPGPDLCGARPAIGGSPNFPIPLCVYPAGHSGDHTWEAHPQPPTCGAESRFLDRCRFRAGHPGGHSFHPSATWSPDR